MTPLDPAAGLDLVTIDACAKAAEDTPLIPHWAAEGAKLGIVARIRSLTAGLPSSAPACRSYWHEFVHKFTRDWPGSHPDDYDPTDDQLIDLCLAAIERDRASRVDGKAR